MSKHGEKAEILVVDDDENSLLLLAQVLKSGGYKVRTASSAQKAFKSIKKKLPDLVMLDIMMPEVDGYEMCRILKSDEATRDVPVLFVSALHGIEQLQKAFDTGGVDYVTKPFRQEEVLLRVQTHLKLFDEHEKLEEEVDRRAVEMEKFFELSLDMLCIANTQGYFQSINKAFETTLGYSQSELLEKKFLEFVHPEDVQKTLEVAKYSEQNVVIDFINRYRCKDGSYRWIEWRSAPSGNLIYAAARDITQRMNLEERLKAEKVQLSRNEHSLKEAQRIAHIGNWEHDLKENTIFWSDEIYRFLGYEPQSFSINYEKLQRFIHPVDREEAKEIYLTAIDKGSSFHHMHRFINVSDEEVYVDIRGEIVCDAKGNAIKGVGTALDVTELKRVEQQLEQANRELEAKVIERTKELEYQSYKYQRLFNSGSDAILVNYLSDEGTPLQYVEVNDKACEMLGYAREELLKYTPQDLISAESKKKLPQWSEKLLKEGHLIIEDELLTKDGKPLSVELNIQLINIDGKKGTFVSARDTSYRKVLEEEKKQQEQLLIHQARFAAIGEMIGAIAHQWRQPLTSLGGVVMGIQDDYEFGNISEQSLQKQVDTAEELLSYMSHTIDDFRNYFDPQKQKVRFDVRQSIVEAFKLLKGQFEFYRIRYELECFFKKVPSECKTLYYPCYGMPNEFKQVIINIFSNAKDAFAAANIEGVIRVEINKTSDNIIIEVTDNAGGIPEAILGKVFDPYFTTKEKSQGTGLGLYMAKAIIEKNMGGTIVAKNRGQGASICISLPLDNR